MTNIEKYAVILDTLAEAIKAKENTISYQAYQIEDLKAKLKAAEEEASGKVCKTKIEYRGDDK